MEQNNEEKRIEDLDKEIIEKKEEIKELDDVERREKEELHHLEEKRNEIERKKKITIVVNGDPHEEEKGEMTYDEIVTIAFPDFPQHPERNYSVKYIHGPAHKPEGILAPGGKVHIKDGMEFTVTPTGQS